MSIEKLTGLEEGEFTKRDEIVRKKAQKILIERSIYGSISRYVANELVLENKKEGIFRRRTASEILDSGYTTGCTDSALAFLVLARQLGLPTLFVESFEKNWLLGDQKGIIQGHIFIDLLMDGEWNSYEPKRGFCREGYNLKEKIYCPVAKGVDFSELYVLKNGIYRKDPIELQTCEQLRKLAKEFK